MNKDRKKHYRRSVRLKGYDYSTPGIYFLTICTKDRKNLFGRIINGQMQLNELGYQIAVDWKTIPQKIMVVKLDEFMIMPNHLHGLVAIQDWQLLPEKNDGVSVKSLLNLNISRLKDITYI